MFIERPPENIKKKVVNKKITLRIPEKLWSSIQNKAKKEYTGKGKQSQLVNDALRHFLKNSAIDDIDWDNPADNYILINLLTQIKLGSKMKDAGPNPVQINIDLHVYESLLDLELKIKNTRKLMDTHIKPSIIRICLSQWMYADRSVLS